jgi:hypothetical protein
MSKYTKFEDVYMNILRIISFRKSDIYYEILGRASQKQSFNQ